MKIYNHEISQPTTQNIIKKNDNLNPNTPKPISDIHKGSLESILNNLQLEIYKEETNQTKLPKIHWLVQYNRPR